MEVLENGCFVLRAVVSDNHAANVAAYKFLLKEDGREPNDLAYIPVARRLTNTICTKERVCCPGFFTVRLVRGSKRAGKLILENHLNRLQITPKI